MSGLTVNGVAPEIANAFFQQMMSAFAGAQTSPPSLPSSSVPSSSSPPQSSSSQGAPAFDSSVIDPRLRVDERVFEALIEIKARLTSLEVEVAEVVKRPAEAPAEDLGATKSKKPHLARFFATLSAQEKVLRGELQVCTQSNIYKVEYMH